MSRAFRRALATALGIAVAAGWAMPAAANGNTIAWGSLPAGPLPGLSLTAGAVDRTAQGCTLPLTVRNRFALTLDRIILDLTLSAADGTTVGAGQVELGALPPAGMRAVGVALAPSPGAERDCRDAAVLAVVPRACLAGAIDLFDACRAGLDGESAMLALTFDRAAAPYPRGEDGRLTRPGRRVAGAEPLDVPAGGLTLSGLSETLAASFAVEAETEGLLVVAVAPEGPAAAAGLEAGDVIVEVDQEPAADRDATAAALRNGIEEGSPLLLLLERSGEVRFVILH